VPNANGREVLTRAAARIAPALVLDGRLTPLGMVLVVVLAAWALLVTMPDALRVVQPLGMLGFTADNDGLVSAVAPGGPAERAGVRAGDRIALDAMSCRVSRDGCRQLFFVFGGMGGLQYVRSGAHVALQFRRADQPPGSRPALHAVIDAVREPQGRDGAGHALWIAALVADELGALAFILCAAVLVWRGPCAMTAGFFLYALWFNPGQYFEFYSWLQGHVAAMIAQETLQAIFQALGYVGFLVLALTFPNDRVRPRLRWILGLLPVVFVVLAALQFASFLNVFGVPTENVTRASYIAGWIVDVAVILILPVLLIDQPPEERARTRWLLTGCVAGLSCFIFADFSEATTMSPWELPETAANFLYFANVFTLAAFAYSVVHHRVVNVSFAVTRGVERLALWALVTAFGAYVIHRVDFELGEVHWGEVGVSLVLIGATLAWERIQETTIERLDVVLFPRFRRALSALAALGERIRAFASIPHLERSITELVASELRISSAAVFRRRRPGEFRRCAAVGWPRGFDRIAPDSPLLAGAAAKRGGHVRLHTPDWVATGFARGVAVPTVALPICMFGEVRAIALYGAHHRGDALNGEEVEALEELVERAGLAYEAIEASAMRRQIRALARRLSPAADAR